MRLACAVIATGLAFGVGGHAEGVTAAGVVVDSAGPVADAVVRVQTTDVDTRTDAAGRFVLALPDTAAQLTAFAPEYYIAGPADARADDTDIVLTLSRHDAVDNPSYEWVGASAAHGDDQNCENCHSAPGRPAARLTYDEWVTDAHGRSATNPRFLSMYNGTDLRGERRGALTRYVRHRDYGRIPLPAAKGEPDYGPGYRLDLPDLPGNCATCHAPVAASADPYGVDPNHLTATAREGVTCDVCHKVMDVVTDPDTGLPHENMPGVLSTSFLRPSDGRQLFIGPYDDVAPGEDTYAPIQEQSAFCAPCHHAKFWGVEVYNSYGEWLDSPYADPEGGRTCQDCHMPRRGVTHVVDADKGGLARRPDTIHSHRMLGARDEEFIADAVTMATEAERADAQIRVRVRITNSGAGHHMPTGYPARHMLLVVAAEDVAGARLAQVSGPSLPEWAGAGQEPDDYAGRPGKAYAKVLEELWTETAPSAAYWRKTTLREDTRIPAGATDSSEYAFAAPGAEAVTVTASLVFRRAFKALADAKGWEDPDILIAHRVARIPAAGR